jgi:hypothetical protein
MERSYVDHKSVLPETKFTLMVLGEKVHQYKYLRIIKGVQLRKFLLGERCFLNRIAVLLDDSSLETCDI